MTMLQKPLTIIADVLIGAAILALPIPIVPRVLIFIIQFAARRVPFLARGFWLLFGCPPRYITCWALPGLVLSSADTGVTSGAPSADEEVLGLQHQEDDTEPDVISTAVLLLSRHNLDARATAELLAVLQKPEGGYYLSANQICKVIGKNEATVKGWVRVMRPETLRDTDGGPLPPKGSQGRWERNDRGELIKVK